MLFVKNNKIKYNFNNKKKEFISLCGYLQDKKNVLEDMVFVAKKL